ncbi:MAG: hypothetical protein ACQETJ_11945 [Bacteroidota bacterium]
MSTRYLPVDPDYYEIVEKAISEEKVVAVHYFGDDNSIKSAKAKVKEIQTNSENEEFVKLDNGEQIRIDRIIVLGGKPGPAFDEYDAYALACLDCTGGMD